jgi:hypothetical protein
MNPLGKKTWIACSVLSFGLLSGCGGGNGASGDAVGGAVGGGANSAPAVGLLAINLTDRPSCGFDQVNVTIDKIRVHQSSSAGATDSGWTDIALDAGRKINLLDLDNGVLEKLGQIQLSAGHYSQLRLVLKENSTLDPLANSVVATGGIESALDTPSGMSGGIRLAHGFDVVAGDKVDLTIDFDACTSVISRGNGTYLMKPTFSVVQMSASGAIAGTLDPAMLASNPQITVQHNGAVIKSTLPGADGRFLLSPISAGSYNVVVTASGHASTIIAGVPVVAAGTTTVSDAQAPLPMIESNESTLSGSVLPVVAVGDVKVSQSIAGGPTVMISSKAAAFATGAYSMALPVAAPMVGQYGTGRPIAYHAHPAAEGKYTVEATASGYRTQVAAIDVSRLNLIMNFNLIP